MIEIKMNTRVHYGVELILNGEVNPIIDFDGTRYHIDISNWELGNIIWTPFDIQTEARIGEYSYSVPYAHHNIFRETILGPSSTLYKQSPIITSFPDYPVTPDGGIVRP